MKAYVKIALFVVFFIAVSAAFTALYYLNLEHTDMSVAKPDFIISAGQLQKDFENDETAASIKYINKILEVTGIISSVDKTGNTTTINLGTENGSSSVICTISGVDAPSEIKRGDEITIRGECSGFLMDVLLNNCSIIK